MRELGSITGFTIDFDYLIGACVFTIDLSSIEIKEMMILEKKFYPLSWMKDKHGVPFFLSEQLVEISLRFEDRFLVLLFYFLSFYFMNVSSTIKKTEI